MHQATVRLERPDSGNALLVALVVTISLVGVTLTSFVVVQGGAQEQVALHEQMRRIYFAELGVERALYNLSSGGAGDVGTEQAPLQTTDGAYWADSTDLGDNTYRIVSHGVVRGEARTIEAVILLETHVFHHSVFAGNASGDPTYQLDFGGTGAEADEVVGDVYSGNDVAITGGATIDGTIRASGDITGGTGETGLSQPIPDLGAMGYETNHDVDVVAEFAAATYLYDDAGGSAWQLPPTSPAHFLRKNPSDRNGANNSTVKDDFFLEDPYEPVTKDVNQDGTSPYRISVNEAGPPVSPSQPFRRIYYIDGNLWLHNNPTFSFQFVSLGLGTQITFAVRGNIYLSDNIFADDPEHDGVALIALKDPNVADSGNIYFGDPIGGTLEYMDAYLYAENDFLDHNLDASGSKVVVLNGTMSAGNHVSIDRDYADHHSKLSVFMDSRLRDGLIELPGVPGLDNKLKYSVVSWREVSKDT